MILHPQGPNLGAIHSLPRHPNTSNTPRSCPQDKTIKTSTHLQSAGGVSAVELTPRRRYLYTTSTMYCTRRCNWYLYTTSDQTTCQPIQAFWKGRCLQALTDSSLLLLMQEKLSESQKWPRNFRATCLWWCMNSASLWLFLCNNWYEHHSKAPLNDEKNTCEWFRIVQSSQPSLASNKPWRSIEDVVAMFQFSESSKRRL